MTPDKIYQGFQRIMGGVENIEEVDDEPNDDDFGNNKRGAVSTTAGSDNFHVEGDVINEDAYVDTNNMLQLTDYIHLMIDFHKSPHILVVLKTHFLQSHNFVLLN
jgi:hypothetical protein